MNLIYKAQYIYIYIFIPYRNLNRLTNLGEIWHRYIYLDGGKVLKIVSTLYPDPRGQGALKQGMGCIYSLNREARQKLY
jgi:hypothetical protein